MNNTVGALLWNIEKVVSKGDYNYAIVKNHPKATKHGYVLEHRIIVENHLGRVLDTNEVIHHMNGDKKDNRIENLQLMTVSSHSSLHGLEQGKILVELSCPWCKQTFIRRKGNTHLVKPQNTTCCSKSCRGKLSRYIQLHGITQQVELAISGNIIRVFNDNSEQTN